jgi:hypothetical protein
VGTKTPDSVSNAFVGENKWLKTAQAVMLSATIASAIAYLFLGYVFKQPVFSDQGFIETNDAGYYLRQAGVRIADLIRVPVINSVTTRELARQADPNMFADELAILASVLFATPIIFAFLRFFTKRATCFVAAVAAIATWWWTSKWTSTLLAPRFLLIAPAALLLILWLPTIPETPRKWPLPAALLASLALLALSLSGPTYSLAHPKDLNSLEIKLSRGPCFGPCVSSQTTIRGNGTMEYSKVVERHDAPRVTELTTAAISKDQLASVLQELDSIRFFAITDRAFTWCFDTPSVGLSVSLDGHTKLVVADAFCVGAKYGTQARFVNAAQRIDTIIAAAIASSASR